MLPALAITSLMSVAQIAPHGSSAGAPATPSLRYVMSSPAAEVYTTEEKASQTGERRAIAQALPGVRISSRLSRAAAAYARMVPRDTPIQPPLAAIEFIVHWAGLPDTSAVATALYTTEDGPADVIDAVTKLLAEPGMHGLTHVGVARVQARAEPYRWRWGIVAVQRKARLRSFPSHGSPGDVLPLQFRLAGGLAIPWIILLRPDGTVHKLTAGASGEWGVARIPLGDRAGTVWVEIAARGSSGPQVAALFPVTVGGPPPAVWEGPAPPDETAVRSTADAEALMLGLVNADRRRFGLAQVAGDPELAAIARRHSADMAANGFFGHVSPTRGGLPRRLALGGYAVRWSGENLSRADSIYESEEALMRSPGHRANILAPQPTRVGIGVVSAPPDTRPRWVVTQIFARPLRKLSSSTFAGETRRTFSVNLPPGAGASLPRNREVDRIAEQIARRLHAGEIDQEAAADEAGRLLNDAGIAFRKLTVLSYEVPEPTDIAVPEEASGPHVKAVGIGAIADPKSLLTLAVVLVVEE